MAFTPSPAFRIANRMVTPLVRWGLPMGTKKAPMALLTVEGRRSGIERTTTVALERHGDGWLLIAVYGVCDWSRNLEASGEGTIMSRGNMTKVRAARLDPGDAGPILRDAISGAPAMVRRMTAPYFSAQRESPAPEWEQEAVDHPVFILTPTPFETPRGRDADLA
jgi:deazaflavin-dependent oxidoreductase (nitroreductase family)